MVHHYYYYLFIYLIEPPPPNLSLTWLFNITADPNERGNVAVKYPDVVKQLMEKLELYNEMHIKQLAPSLDYRSDPALHHGVAMESMAKIVAML